MRGNSLGFTGEENPLNYLLQTCGGHEPVPGWATVTSAAPLRVRKDHEESALDVTPQTLVGGLAEGDRVLLAEWAGQPVILGRAGGEPVDDTGWVTPSLASNTDPVPPHGHAIAVRRIGAVVHMRGRIQRLNRQNYSAGDVFGSNTPFTLAPEFRPRESVSFATMAAGFTNPNPARIEFRTNGEVAVGLTRTSSWLDFDGMYWFLD